MDLLAPAREVVRRAERENAASGHENAGFLSEARGLMPVVDPLTSFGLTGPWAEWDELATTAPELYSTLRLRTTIDAMSIASADELPDAALLRAATLLGVYAHAYVRATVEPAELPESLTQPWDGVCARLERAYAHLTYVDLIIHNWQRVTPWGPNTVPNMTLLAPTVGSENERVFYLTQVEILSRGTAAFVAVLDAQDAIVREDAPGFVEACDRIADTLERVALKPLLQIDPNPRSPSHVDQTVWARTVAPLAVPLKQGLPGPSGTQSPLFAVLDTFVERHRFASELGIESNRIRGAYPRHWRDFLDAAAETPASTFLSRVDRKDVHSAYRQVLEAYAGPNGFLSRHKLKVYGFLDVGFKVGRSVTIGGFRGQFQHRAWEEVDQQLDHSRAEREATEETAAGVAKLGRLIETDAIAQIVLDVEGLHLRPRPGDRLAVLPTNSDDSVATALRALGARGDEPIRLTGAWRDAVAVRTSTVAMTLPLADLLRWGELRPVSRDAAKTIADTSGSAEVRRIVDQRLESRWGLASIIDLAAGLGWLPSQLWRAEPGEREHIARLVPPLRFRTYSIAGIDPAHDGTARGIELWVGKLRYTSDDGEYRGTASSFLADPANHGAPAPVRLVRPVRFWLPDDDDLPVAMLAGGSGLAPFLSFLESRKGRTGAQDLLFLAMRQRSEVPDHILTPLETAGRLQTFHAISAEGRRIDALLADPDAVSALRDLVDNEGYFYLCGRTGFARTVLSKLEELFGADRMLDLLSLGRFGLEVFTTFEDPASLPEVEASTLVQSNGPSGPALMAIDGKVVDLDQFQQWHPGGVQALRGYLGMDATDVYRRVGHDIASEVDALLGLYTVGRMRRLDMSGQIDVVLTPEGLRTLDAAGWFRRWVRATYALVELQNAQRLEHELQDRRLTLAENPGDVSRYRLHFGFDTFDRFHSNLFDWFLSRPIADLWAATVGLCAPDRDIRELTNSIEHARSQPNVQAAEALTARAMQALLHDEIDPAAWQAWTLDLAAQQAQALSQVMGSMRDGLTAFERSGPQVRAESGSELVAALDRLPAIVTDYGDGVARCAWPK